MAAGTVIDELIVEIQGDASGLSKVYDEVKSQSNKLEKTVDSMSSSLDKSMSSAVNHLQSQSSKLGGTLGNLSSSIGSGVTGATSKASHSILDLASKMGMGVFAFKEIASTALGAAQSLLAPHASMEQLQIGFTTLMKSSEKANDMLNQLSQFAANTPFEMPEIAEAGQLLLAMGTDAKEVIPLLTDIGDTLSGLGRSGAEMKDVVMIFGQIKAEGKVTADNINQLTERGINAWGFMAKAMGKSIPEVRKLSEQGLIPADFALKAIRKGMQETFGGGMQAQSKSFNGIMANLKDNITKAWLAFSGPAFNAAKGALSTLTNFISGPAFQGFAKNMGEQLNKAFSGLGTLLAPVMKGFSDVFGAIGANLGPIFQQIASSFNTVFGGNNAESAKAFSSIFQQIGGAISGLVPFINQVAQSFSQWLAEGNLTAILEDFKNALVAVGTFVMKNIVPAVKAALPGFLELGRVIATVIVPAIAELIRGRLDAMMGIFKALAPVFAVVVPELIKFAGVIGGAIAEAIKFLMPYIIQMNDAINKFAVEIAQRIAPIILQWFNQMKEGLQAFATFWGFVWPGIATTLAGVWDMIVGVVQIAWSLISGIIKIGLSLLSGNWQQAWEDMKTMLQGVWDGFNKMINGSMKAMLGIILTAGGAILAAITAPFKDAVGKVQGFLNDIGNKIRSWVPPMPAMPNISLPGHATGIQNNPVGHMAWVGERGKELMYIPPGASVFSHSQSMGMMSPGAAASIATGGGSGGGGNQTFIFEWDGQTFARLNGRYTDKEVRLQLGARSR